MKVNDKKYSKRDLEIIKARLIDGKSFREIETEILKINSPVRGGGFKAKKILDSYGVLTKYKGTITEQNISNKIKNYDGLFSETLIELKKYINDRNKRNIEIKSTDIKIEKDREFLLKRFKHRLSTQNRFYDFMIFPIKFIKSILKRRFDNDEIDKIIEQQALSIKFRTLNNEFTLNDIEKIIITKNNKVFIFNKNKAYHKLQTRISNSNQYKDIEANKIEEIVIDHIIPQKTIIKKISKDLNALSTIHRIATDINNGRKLNDERFSYISDKVEKELIDVADSEFIEKLIDEIRLIAENSDLEIMSSKENSSKSNKQTNWYVLYS